MDQARAALPAPDVRRVVAIQRGDAEEVAERLRVALDEYPKDPGQSIQPRGCFGVVDHQRAGVDRSRAVGGNRHQPALEGGSSERWSVATTPVARGAEH